MKNGLRIAVTIGCLAVASAGAQDFEGVEIRSTKVADGIWMLEGQGGNIGVSAGEDGVFLIDDQFAPLTEKIRAAVAKIEDRPIRFVLNTHWHGDHTGGNENLGKAGAVIVAHENVRRRMSVEQVNEILDRTTPPSPAAALPVITFTESVTFHLNGQEIHAFHVDPAHTDGDTMIHFRTADVLHLGDVFFNRLYPFIDVASGGSVEGVLAAVDRALGIAASKTRIIPGHGALSDRAGLESYRKMLATVRDRVKEAIAAGKSEAEVIAAHPTAEFDDVWGKGFMNPERFTRIVYQDLSR